MSTQDSDAVQEFLGINLPHHSTISQARITALREGIRGDVAPTSLVSFSSSGIVALIGPLPSALQVAEGLDEISSCVIIATDGGEAGQTETRDINGRTAAIIFGRPTSISGYLGNFEITLSREEGDEEIHETSSDTRDGDTGNDAPDRESMREKELEHSVPAQQVGLSKEKVSETFAEKSERLTGDISDQEKKI